MRHDAKPDRFRPGMIECTCEAGPFTQSGYDRHVAAVEERRRPRKSVRPQVPGDT